MGQAHSSIGRYKSNRTLISHLTGPKKLLTLLKPCLLDLRPQSVALTNHTRTPIPGLHIVANFSVADANKIAEFYSFRNFIDIQIKNFALSKVGEVYHNFPGGGFTGVVCLTESHLSIHTWPEQNYITFDVFLSNYLKDNRTTTMALYIAVKNFYNAEVSFEQIIDR
jgi:S-adenosylmethionine decarboxylase